MDAKHVFLTAEGNNYFYRNRTANTAEFAVKKINRYGNFFDTMQNNDLKIRFLEIGCSDGFLLNHVHKTFGFEVMGIEPSQAAVESGNERYFTPPPVGDVSVPVLQQGTGDSLPFEDDSFDVVLLGFYLFWVDRKYIFRCISEADRVLKEKGFILLEDFDTPLPYKRINCHNADAFTYKYDYTKLFLANPQYTLVSKTSYTHSQDSFNIEIQERVSSNILFKECIDNVYVDA